MGAPQGVEYGMRMVLEIKSFAAKARVSDGVYGTELQRAGLAAGANFIGGCCGTGPEHIRAIRKAVDRL
ncbi:MAG: homocysteine S-methyltransferase family protein [Phycisphaerae bacterium]|nr:homocysteine S-methyltransferase family protein [Phycisphaerae bacterium]